MDVVSALKVATERLGFEELKEKQIEALKAFADGKDVFVSLPTGYGKSLCYQILPFLYDALRGCAGRDETRTASIVVVVTPLVSIMKDQVSDLNNRQVSAIHILSSAVSEGQRGAIMQGEYSIVYISPEELLQHGRWRDMLHSEVYQKNLVGFVIDEAHCVKKW